MEAAIYENRRTLEAIKETQGQRDLFKNLITETTHYVAAEYVRALPRRAASPSWPSRHALSSPANAVCWPRRSSAPSIWRTRWISSPTARSS